MTIRETVFCTLFSHVFHRFRNKTRMAGSRGDIGNSGLLVLLAVFLFPAICFGQAPVADFSADVVSGCKPLFVKFTDQSTNNSTSWKWDLGNGAISPAQNPVATYTEAGTYTVQLTATNANGSDVVVKTAFITVYDVPAADFSTNDTIGCAPLPSHFTDKTDGAGAAIIQWDWAFGDGGTSNVQNPDYTYATAGTYNVSLKVVNGRGCSNVVFKPQYIKSGGSFTADFSSSISPYCNTPVSVSFSNLSNGTDSLAYAWDFGDGTSSNSGFPSHNYNSFGDFTVSLVGFSSAGCSDTIVKVINIPLKLVDFSGPQKVCAGSAVNYQVISNPAPLFVTWKMGDGAQYNTTNITHTYTSSGIYTVTLINDFGGCIDSVSKQVVVSNTALADFTSLDIAACKAPHTVSFSNKSPDVVSQTWNFGDLGTASTKNPVHTYKTEGNFTVTLEVTDSAGCTSSITKTAFIKIIKPDIKLKLPVSGCAPFYFAPLYTIAHADSIKSYLWSFGDGGTSADSLPAYIYNTAGSYNVSLIIETEGGCRDTASIDNGVRVSVNTSNTFDFKVDTSIICVNKTVAFTSDATGPNLAYRWYFGDNISSGVKNAFHSYADTGLYSVRLDVSFGGCTSSVTKKDFVKVIGSASKFTFTKDCSQRGKFLFTNVSTNGLSNVWDFGDGAASTDFSPEHTYTSSGEYKVKLISVNNCSDTSEQVVQVGLENISVSVDKTNICKGEPIIFTVVHPQPDLVVSYSFNFSGNLSDGFITTSENVVSWTYKTAGTYKVTVVTADRFGCRDTVELSSLISVHGPTAQFGVVTNFQCAGQATDFADNSVTNGSSTIVGWTWYYGDGSVQDYTAPPFSHVYTLSGRFSVGLKITDDAGCTDSLTQPDLVTSYYAAADFISVDSFSCPGKPVRFTDRSAGPVFSRLWSFGDGSFSTAANPLHVYASTGTYTVKLTIFSAGGCNDSITKTNYISISYPSAYFSLSDSVALCPPLQVSFTDSSQYAASYVWSLGDGSISTVQNPAANYFLPGKYDVKLIITSPGGCKDSAFASIRVAGPNGIISYSPSLGCIPVASKFKVATTGAIYFTWDFGDGFTTQGPDSAALHTYTSGGKFLPKVLIRNPEGCSVPIIGKDTVFIESLIPKFSVSTNIVCDTAAVYFADSSVSTGALTYQWSFGDGTGSALQNPSHSYSSPGKYSVKLIITSSLGCADSVTYADFIDVFKLPEISIIADPEACAGGVVFRSQTTADPLSAIVDYTWTFGNRDSSKLANPPEQIFAAGTYNVILTAVNDKGCMATDSQQLIVHPVPVLVRSTDTTICRGDTIQLGASGAGSYNWVASSASLSCTSCDKPFVYPAQHETYTITGTSADGCIAIDSVDVTVLQPFTVQTSPAFDICLGKSVQLTSSGAPLYKWFPSAGLSSPDIFNPIATPDSTTSYVVIGYDSLGCFTDSASVVISVNAYPTVELGNDIIASVASKFLITPVLSNNAATFLWTPSDFLSCSTCAAPELTATRNITYHLVVTTDRGCSAEDTLQVTVTCGNSALFVPNTFSPNRDGSNDIFYIRAKGISAVHAFKILSRSGQTMFEKRYVTPNDISGGWDGTFQGKPMETGVYIYYLEVVCDNNEVLKYSGNISLIR